MDLYLQGDASTSLSNRKYLFFPKVRGRRVNCICAMTMDGPLAIKTTFEGVNGDRFMDFVRTELTHHLTLDSVLVLGK